jgi:glyoxylase-like metal-dependent hydrolase (beta-lactamase superfamily II)
LITLTYQSTHYFLLEVTGGWFMVDAGWPGSLPMLSSKLKAYRLDGRQIRYVLPTHFHPDHAGLAQEIKQAWGTRLIVHQQQVPFIPQLAEHYAKKGGYVPVRVEAQDLILTGDGRQVLKGLGLDGQVVLTPGHSDDSVSLVLDSGEAFVGDLPPPFIADDATVRASWQALRAAGARVIYPSHTGPVALDAMEPGSRSDD